MSKFLRFCGMYVTAAVFLAACGSQGEQPGAADPATRTSAVAPNEQAASLPPVEQKNPDVEFAVSPATVPGCGETSALQARISWQVRNTAVEQVRVEVADPGQDNWKVLSVGGRQGEAETGTWVRDGTRFRLIYSATGEQLANHQVTGSGCSPG